jgi:hypothetical protein
MPTKTWTFEKDGRTHTVKLEHSLLTGSKTISVDYKVLQTVHQKKWYLTDYGSILSFATHGCHCLISILHNNDFLGFSYDLFVNGVSVSTGEESSYGTEVAKLEEIKHSPKRYLRLLITSGSVLILLLLYVTVFWKGMTLSPSAVNLLLTALILVLSWLLSYFGILEKIENRKHRAILALPASLAASLWFLQGFTYLRTVTSPTIYWHIHFALLILIIIGVNTWILKTKKV